MVPQHIKTKFIYKLNTFMDDISVGFENHNLLWRTLRAIFSGDVNNCGNFLHSKLAKWFN
jgi:predicted AAA+ superfamily ATPase